MSRCYVQIGTDIIRGCIQEEIGIEADEDVGCNIVDYSNLGVKKQKTGH